MNKKHTPKILYKDDFIIVTEKPAGMLTIPDRFDKSQLSLKDFLLKTHEEVIPVHRLDRDTSGVIVFALTQEAHVILSKSFFQRIVEKYYLAVVDGHTPDTGTIDAPLTESTARRGKMLVHQRGKESLSSFETLQRFDHASLVRVLLHTGRMHQIRVHMAHIGHPLVVDPLYGKREAFFLSELKGRKYKGNEDERPLINRMPLHAEQLIISHPVTIEKMKFTAETPKDIRALISQLEKNSKTINT
jgi:23S rRNA pseudouridine1911/1915/1917 synthase